MNIVRRHISIGIISGLIAILFNLIPHGEFLELKGYDLLHILKRPASPPENIIIVAIDEPSFAEIGRQWPWPRDIHASLIDALKKEGAAVIGMDIIFAEPSSSDADAVLASSLRAAGNVCLASDVELVINRSYSQEISVEPIPLLKKEASAGLTTIPIDIDNVVRRFYQAKKDEVLFAQQIARMDLHREHALPEDAYISYVGPPGSFASVSYYQALRPSEYLPRDFFRDKIAIIGMSLKNVADPGRSHPDIFATPFLYSLNSRLMSGAEIQANMVHNFLTGSFIIRLGEWKRIMLFLILGIIGSFLQVRWRPVLSGTLAILCFAVYIAIASGYFYAKNLWIPTISAFLPFLVPFGIFGITAYISTEKRRQEIKRAFSHYLSPAVLDVILKNPDRLKLGGEKIEATVLFSDIAGFTGMSEKMNPEDVSRFLNHYFDEMTKIIFRHRGTVDKFVGDSIMAFWGAPMPDKDHALNACRAAVAMQERLMSLREEMKREGMPELFIRIGIHSGTVIAGNMGSPELFNYTVLGDTVNLASRLESANKGFGTSILVSRSVVQKADHHLRVNPLGHIKVAGKTENVEIFELLGT